MEIEILNERENPLLERKEINFRAIYESATPNINEVKNKLINVLKSDESLTVVDVIKPEFGRCAAHGYVKIYANSNALAIEPGHRIKKNLIVAGKEEKEKIEESKEEGKKNEEVKENA